MITSKSGERQRKFWRDIKALREAWFVQGTHPEYHRRQQERLKKEWPTLYRAIKNLL